MTNMLCGNPRVFCRISGNGFKQCFGILTETLKQRYVEVEEEYQRQSKLLQDTLDDFKSTKVCTYT